MLTSIQLQHRFRNFKQKLFGIRVAVIGGYHGGNLGDMALGESLITVLKNKKIKVGLQTIYNLNKWPKAKFAIIGGGAVGYNEPLNNVSIRYKGNYKNIALLGVDFNEKVYTKDSIELMKTAAYISARNEEQAQRIMLICGRQDVKFHPDIAFSLYQDYCAKQRQLKLKKLTKKFLVNIVPLYAKVVDGKIVSALRYETERPELFKAFDQMQLSYKKLLIDIIEDALSKGFEVETIPFTPLDEAYGKIILEGLPVTHSKYHADPYKMVKKMSTAELILATRYHATIFALKLGVPFYPIAYAVKNELLLQELGISKANFITSTDLSVGYQTMKEPVTVDAELISRWESKTSSVIEECINYISQTSN